MRKNLWIMSTGTELSQGRSQDTNAPEIAAKVTDYGFDVAGFSTLPDNPELLLNHFQWLQNQPNIHGFIMTGGLGPTDDDYTIDVLAKWTDSPIIEHLPSLERLKSVRLTLQRRPLGIETARRQVRVLEKSEVIENKTGLAPGVIGQYLQSNFWFAALPGVPSEMRNMIDSVLEKFQHEFRTKATYRFDAYIYEEPESEFQRIVFNDKPLIPSTIKDDPEFRWGITAKPNVLKVFFEHETNETVLKNVESILKTHYQHRFLDQSVEQLIHHLLIERKLTLSLAESCTGGLIAKLITDISGSSRYFLGSAVTYSNQSKHKIINVPNHIIDTFGAVSEECALAMAEGAKYEFGSDIALSVTGIAGPNGGSDEKPVGTVFMSIVDKSHQTVFRLFFPFHRQKVREFSARTGLFRLYRFLTTS